jgi:hypothetical protein
VTLLAQPHQLGGLHQFGSNWRRSGQSGTPGGDRSVATNPLHKSPALIAFIPMPEERSTLSAKLSRFPRLGLAHLPTPLEPMRRLTEHLGGPRLWVKREDATGVGFGGNKLLNHIIVRARNQLTILSPEDRAAAEEVFDRLAERVMARP